jgi:hypothetical protein
MKEIIVSSEGKGIWGKKVVDFLIKNAYPKCNVKYEMSLDCNIIILSHFINDEPLWNKQLKKYIYWSGESYDVVKHSKASYFLELLTRIKEEEKDNYIYIPFVLYSHYLYKDRKYKKDICERPYVLAYCNSNPVKCREEFYNTMIKKIGEDADKCHAFGNCYGEYKNTHKKLEGDWHDEVLIDTYKDYKFVIAIENKDVDGYVTEKILNAFYSGAIPIFKGSSNINDLFNKKAFVNLADFETVQECVNHIVNMTNEELIAMQNEPIYNETSEIIHLMNDDFYSKHGNKIRDRYVKMMREFLDK